MNVFVLCTGRSGSTSFFRACQHITNYTSGHESRTREIGLARFAYPSNHIEVDNRLSWLLGRLERAFGDRAFYVHLLRDERETARSFDKRWAGRGSIIRAYAEGILGRKDRSEEICLDYCRTVNANISAFLEGKARKLTFQLEAASERFPIFWEAIGAQGNLEAALAEFEIRHNPSAGPIARGYRGLVWRALKSFR